MKGVGNLMMVLAALMLVLAISIKAAEFYPEEAASDSLEMDWAEFDGSERWKPTRPMFGKKKTGCTRKCTDKCGARLGNKAPVLMGYCNKSCNMQCELRFMDRLYKCTIHCANSMPPHFKKNPKRAENYVEQCDKKCMKKHKQE